MSPVPSNLAMWSLIVGFLSPLVLSLIQQPRWTNQLRALVTFVFCAVVAVPTAYFSDDLRGKDYVTTGLLIFTVAISTYRNLWKPTGISPSIEHGSSPPSQQVGKTGVPGGDQIAAADNQGHNPV